jgi:valine dehydrogenase (NAD+)
VTDVSAEAVDAVRAAHPEVQVVDDVEALVRADLDVYSPNALGHALADDVVAVLKARLVCGGANNQLAHPGTEDLLAERGILYAPDYLVNAGGVIQVAEELHGFDFARARAKAERIFDTTRRVLALAAEEGVPPAVAADRLAEERMAGR